MGADIESFNLAGAELSWPIGSAAGMTNHPDIEVVARRFEEYASYGLGFVTLGSFKLGGPSGGNAHNQKSDGTWDYFGGDEFVDTKSGYGYNSKGLPGPGVDLAISRISDFVDLAKSKETQLAISFSPHTSNPIEEIDELLSAAKKALQAGVLFVEFNLSCPNIPDRPAFYKDPEAIFQFYEKLEGKETWYLNRFGHAGIFPKFGPMEQTADEIQLRKVIWSGTIRRYRTFGGVVTSNTIGNQIPKKSDGTNAIEVNSGKAGASGPALQYEGWRQLALWRNVSQIYKQESVGELISVLGIDSGNEVFRRLRLGAKACELGSILYWPELIGEESAKSVVEKVKKELVDSISR